MSLIKSSWYAYRVKNMHFGSPSDSWDQCRKTKLSYAQHIIKRGEAELRILELPSVFHHFAGVGPKQLCVLAHLGRTRKLGTSYRVSQH